MFWEVPVGKFIDYLLLSRPFADKIYVISHNSRGYDKLCQAVDDMKTDWKQRGKGNHVFWEAPVGKFIDYVLLSRPFADKIYVISHNSRGYDTQCLRRGFLELRWTPQLIMDGTKF